MSRTWNVTADLTAAVSFCSSVLECWDCTLLCSNYKAPSKHDACVSPQLRRCHKPPLPLSLREPRQPPQQQRRRTGAGQTPPPPPQGWKRVAGERPKHLLWFQRQLLLHLWSPSLCPSATARPLRKETSCGLRPHGACWWSDLAPKEHEVNSHLHLRAPSGLIIIWQHLSERTVLVFITSIWHLCIQGLLLLYLSKEQFKSALRELVKSCH